MPVSPALRLGSDRRHGVKYRRRCRKVFFSVSFFFFSRNTLILPKLTTYRLIRGRSSHWPGCLEPDYWIFELVDKLGNEIRSPCFNTKTALQTDIAISCIQLICAFYTYNSFNTALAAIILNIYCFHRKRLKLPNGKPRRCGKAKWSSLNWKFKRKRRTSLS